MPFTSDPGAYSPSLRRCGCSLDVVVTQQPLLGERPGLRENECDGEDLKQCKQHLCFLVVMAPALGRDGLLLRQVQPVALAEVAHFVKRGVIQHHNP